MPFTSQLEQGDWLIVAGWLCLVCALSLYGIGLLLHNVRRRLTAARARDRSPAPSQDRDRPLLAADRRPAAADSSPPETLRQWLLVTEIVESRLARVEAMAAWHAAAVIQVDAAEYALGRLVEECAAVVRRPPAPPVMPAQQPPAARPEPTPLAA